MVLCKLKKKKKTFTCNRTCKELQLINPILKTKESWTNWKLTMLLEPIRELKSWRKWGTQRVTIWQEQKQLEDRIWDLTNCWRLTWTGSRVKPPGTSLEEALIRSGGSGVFTSRGPPGSQSEDCRKYYHDSGRGKGKTTIFKYPHSLLFFLTKSCP